MKRNYNYRKMKRKPCRLPWLLTFVRGAIGKEYVIKHYRYGIIKTKYPDMTNIVASPGQRSCMTQDFLPLGSTLNPSPVAPASHVMPRRFAFLQNVSVSFFAMPALRGSTLNRH